MGFFILALCLVVVWAAVQFSSVLLYLALGCIVAWLALWFLRVVLP